jgi:hypothetical protein
LVVETDLRDMFKKTSKKVFTLTVVESLDPVSPSPSTSLGTKMPDPQCTGPLAITVGNDRTQESKEGDCDAPQPADEEDIRMEYSSDLLCRLNV